MGSSQRAGRSRSRLTGAIVAGLLIVPVTAIAALAIVGTVARPPGAQAAAEVAASTTSVPTLASGATTSTTPVADEADPSDEEALIEACTTDVAGLLAKERGGAITDVESAALDALREICAARGLPISGPPAPAPIVTVVESRPVSAAPASSDSATVHDDHDEDHDEDHGEDDQEEHHEDHDDDHGEDGD